MGRVTITFKFQCEFQISLIKFDISWEELPLHLNFNVNFKSL